MKKKRSFCGYSLLVWLFVMVFVLLLTVALLELFFQYADFYESPEERQILIISNETMIAKETDTRCTFHTCFEVYNCGSSENKLIKVYVYPEFEYVGGNGLRIVPFMSKEFEQLIDSVISSKYYTSNPNEACLFVPQIDFLNQEKVYKKQSSQLLASLPYWNEGKNHLLFNMLPGSFPHFFTSLEVNRDKAIVAGGGFSTSSYRRTFDVSIPVFNALTAHVDLAASSNPKRLWLLASSQIGLHVDYVKELEAMDSKDVLLLQGCKHFDASERCDKFNRVYQYPHILQDSTFCLVLRGNRLGQMELLECMKAGSIPVVMADAYVLPFFDVLEWKSAAVILSELELPRLIGHLRKISKVKVDEMRRQVLFYHQNYLGSMEAIALTTLKIINDRVFPHFASSHEEWNDAQPKLKSPFFLPMLAPKAVGFTAVILTYDRLESLFKLIQQVAQVPSLAKVLVIWNNQLKAPPSAHNWPKINKPLKVIQTQHNRLSNRFYPYQEIETEAILAIDDDILMLTPDELEFAFEVWCEFPDRIVGFPSRLHKWDANQSAWRYESEWMSKLSMVLTGAAFYHKYFNYIYTEGMPAGLKEMADGWMNCEDIAFNFMVTHITGKPPIKVTPRQKFRCPECGNLTALSGDLGDHMFERSKCINRFTEMYNLKSPPLVPVEFRADPVLYKNDFPPTKFHKFNDIGSL